ncbi:hypothetical protein C448_11466 [Halococcus morrhuae DSM 1307]|uniref:Uncharacterized protein n=1 Tax=Halococcus morrhuae DSM 1307 TaxID=931277 RepID=M0M8T1_HALMO|nr:hypothetical protein C448_11466 [Halococcus morrhuae DSM 1307]
MPTISLSVEKRTGSSSARQSASRMLNRVSFPMSANASAGATQSTHSWMSGVLMAVLPRPER